MRSFILILILAPLLDLLGAIFWGVQSSLSSVVGASIWGLALAIGFIRLRAHNHLVRVRYSKFLAFLSGIWLCYFVYGFFHVGNLETPSNSVLRALFAVHGALLAGGASMLVLVALGSLLWIKKEHSLSQRLSHSFLKNWPLESLEKLTRGSYHFALMAWGLGAVLALVTAAIQAPRENEPLLWFGQWIRDPKVFFVFIFWILLLLGMRIQQVDNSQKRFKFYFLFSVVLFLIFLVFISSGISPMHVRINWFSR